MRSFVDSHCHVGEAEYDADRAEVMARARAAGVRQFVVTAAGGTLETNRRALELAEREPDCWAVIGVHPHDAKLVDEALIERIRAWARLPRVVGIGETGLDYHYDHSPRERQLAEFRRFAALAREASLPLVVHSRAAADDTLRVLREERVEAGVMHCFTYGPEVARQAVDLGLYVSFSGIVTFRNAGDVREAARRVPLERLLLETDCPYLAPEPKRGGRNEPARVADVALGLAAAIARPVDEVAERTTENARRLFRLPAD
ncbi:MAG: TatD family hydrolase [Deltaproteobacteria bacterium]|nr:TatD family hydrolase [Deltaproteobacteria bacterium]